jgi:hypothetical protein
MTANKQLQCRILLVLPLRLYLLSTGQLTFSIQSTGVDILQSTRGHLGLHSYGPKLYNYGPKLYTQILTPTFKLKVDQKHWVWEYEDYVDL